MEYDGAAVLEDFVTLEGMLRAFRSELGIELRVTVVGEGAPRAPTTRAGRLFSLPGPGLILERLAGYGAEAIAVDPGTPRPLVAPRRPFPLLAIACGLNVGAMLLALIALLLSL